MRVIAGSLRSVPLESPPGLDTRPTLDVIKETLFNILQFEFKGALVYDVFAGSGSLGIEALSRGALRSVFVDNSYQAVNVIKKNLTRCHLLEKASVYKCDAIRTDIYMRKEALKDSRLIVFMDPPYLKDLEIPVFKSFFEGGYIGDDTLFVLEEARDFDISKIQSLEFLNIIRIKEYKHQKHIFIKKA